MTDADLISYHRRFNLPMRHCTEAMVGDICVWPEGMTMPADVDDVIVDNKLFVRLRDILFEENVWKRVDPDE
jgi:hypothetical protein